jgi:DNA-binding MarR family transcriptional regulator/GNAT superfamily N-acetyltransferase
MVSIPLPTPTEVSALRAFNRFYTRRVGLLNDRLDGSAFSLPQARVLYEIAHGTELTAAAISRSLDMDRAQLSRLLRGFSDKGLIRRTPGTTHAKHQLLALTDSGRAAFTELNALTDSAVARLLTDLPPSSRSQLLAGTERVRGALAPIEPAASAFTLRDPRPGDLGLVTSRQAILYANEFGWDWTYEGLVSRILADFVATFDPARDRAWVAEQNGEVVGSVFLMHTADLAVAKLRLLYVDAQVRGLGVGTALVKACIERARACGYTTLELWTNTVLSSARKIYQAQGFQLVSEAPHHSFGRDLVGQTWALRL